MVSLGINIGSSSLKLVLADGDKVVWSALTPHEGDFHAAVRKLMSEREIPVGTKVLVTGNEGRYLFNAAGTLEPLCVEAALKASGLKADAVASMGGEDLVVYSLDDNGKIINNFSGNLLGRIFLSRCTEHHPCKKNYQDCFKYSFYLVFY